MFFWSVLFGVFLAVHHVSAAAAETCEGGFRSCKDLQVKRKIPADLDSDGIYHLQTEDKGYEYQAYCDMHTDGGGWTLVASIHENNIKGRCTVDDLWSSQQGTGAGGQSDGDGNWNNRVIFGTVEGATSEDYKNPGYYDVPGVTSIAVWHVPNIKRVSDWKTEAYLRYHTTPESVSFGRPHSDFFTTYPDGTLYSFFEANPLKKSTSDLTGKRGTVLPIAYDKGTDAVVTLMHGLHVNVETDPGFLTLRPFNNKGIPFAICPGVRICPNKASVTFAAEHYCVGGGGYQGSSYPTMCGDFNMLDGKFTKSGTVVSGWDAKSILTDSTILIFYR